MDVATRLEEISSERIERIRMVKVLGGLLCAREGEYVDYAAYQGRRRADPRPRQGGRWRGHRDERRAPGVIDIESHARDAQDDKPSRVASTVPLGGVGEPAEVAAAI